MNDDGATLERGAIRFFVRPRVMLPRAERFEDVQRLFVLLRPVREGSSRRLVIGRKRMPDPRRHDKEWAYVDRVGASFADLLEDLGPETYDTKTQGLRIQAGAAEIARGSYVVRPHDDHVHLDYELAEPPALGDLGLLRRGSLIAAVFNPDEKARAPLGGGPREPSIYPDELQERFDGRRFAPLEPAFLDHVGCEVVLIGRETANEVVA